jgi:hypothetical protein
MKSVKVARFTLYLSKTLTLWRTCFEHQSIGAVPVRTSPWKEQKIGRELEREGGPHFFGLQPPKKVCGVAPILGTALRAGRFFHGCRRMTQSSKHHHRRNKMSIVKKVPNIMTREIKLEEPVNELLDDYSCFIESTADHVVNAVLKKVLWRDQDYRKWREAQRKLKFGHESTAPEKT